MAILRRLSFRLLLRSSSIRPASAASTRYPLAGWIPGNLTSLFAVRHGTGQLNRARDRVLNTVSNRHNLETASDLTPLAELATMPNFQAWHAILTQLCGSRDRYVPSAEWDRTFKELTDPRSKVSFFGAMMSLACSFRYQAMGDSLMDHLRSSKIPFNITVTSRYIKLCGRCMGADYEKKVFGAYDDLKRIYPAEMYDVATAENLIAGLYGTSRWEECIKLLDMIDYSGKAGPVAVSFVIAGAFTHDHPDAAMRLLKRLKGQGFSPTAPAFGAWLLWAKTEGYTAIKEMLAFIRDSEWYLPFEMVKELREWMEKKEKWKGKFTTLSPKGECKGCQEYMEPITISKDEFGKLRENFIKAVIEGTDVFLHTNPNELKRYRDFVERNAPFDLVIDGLNVAYHQNSTKFNPRLLAQQLRVVLEHLLRRNQKKILVLGRMHMRQWPKDEMNRISNMASCFFAENVSQDDPFVLYAALYSGLSCDFLSGDLMRDHRFKLAVEDVELRKIFLKWQRTHQMELLKVHQDGTVRIKAPMKFNAVTQWTPTSIHIPYHSGLPLSLHEHPSTWLCLTKDQNSTKTVEASERVEVAA